MNVNLIATQDRTLHLPKVRVSFVTKVSGKIKRDSQIVQVVDLENTMTKRNKLIVNLIAMPDTTLSLTKVNVA